VIKLDDNTCYYYVIFVSVIGLELRVHHDQIFYEERARHCR